MSDPLDSIDYNRLCECAELLLKAIRDPSDVRLQEELCRYTAIERSEAVKFLIRMEEAVVVAPIGSAPSLVPCKATNKLKGGVE